uniref:NPC1_N domain-containing protein n=1 Tax=Parastrongyloides trichosuri TaxID=131310 RepID=A0A0N4Z9C7_PARTI
MSLISGCLCIYCHFTDNKLSEVNINEKLNKTLNYYYGESDYITEAWNLYQVKNLCCGIYSEKDYVKTKWFRNQISHPKKRKPLSCCKTCEQLFSSHCLPNPNLQISKLPKQSAFIDGSQLDTNNCFVVLQICSFNSKYPFSPDMCFGNMPIPFGIPIDFLLNIDGCSKKIYEKDKIVIEKFKIVSYSFLLINGINAIFIIFVYRIIFVKHIYSTIVFDTRKTWDCICNILKN